MGRTLRSVVLVVKEGNQAAEATCVLVRDWLRAHNIGYSVLRHPQENLLEVLDREADLLLVLGGDGTLVSIARRLLGCGLPVAGINFGRVGFLAELAEDTWEECLTRALAVGIDVEYRMTLHYGLFRRGERIRHGEVINDVVVTRGKVARLVNLHMGVNGASFVSLRSDGLILSTPTGSTGYSGSAGGSLLLPTLDAYVVAAICPYLSSFPPLVLPAETVFSITVDDAAADLYLTLDGQEAYALAEGDVLEVVGAPGRFPVANFGCKDYFKRLLQAGFVQESKR